MVSLTKPVRRLFSPKVGVVALVTEAAGALRRGDEKRALLLAGAALVAVKSRTIAYPVYGYVVLRRVLDRLDEDDDPAEIAVEAPDADR